LKDVYISRSHAFAKGTYSNLRTQIRSYFAFCVYFDRTPLPADVVTIHGYVQFLSRSMKPPTIQNYLSGVKMLHIFHGLPDHFSDDFMLELEMKGISRLNPHVPKRATPITPKILLIFHKYMDHTSSLHCSVWACSLFLFYTLSRLGSMLPSSTSTKTHTFLSRDRVNLSVEGLLVTFLHTKTIQFGRRRLHIPLLRSDSVLCPVRAYLRASALSSDGDAGPAFTYHKGGKFRWLTRSVFIKVFRAVLVDGGFDYPSSVTGHSFRRGGATWAFQAGVPGELIQICGDWASDAYKQYLEFSMQSKIELAGRFAKTLPC
jgi:hypothetical protein